MKNKNGKKNGNESAFSNSKFSVFLIERIGAQVGNDTVDHLSELSSKKPFAKNFCNSLEIVFCILSPQELTTY